MSLHSCIEEQTAASRSTVSLEHKYASSSPKAATAKLSSVEDKQSEPAPAKYVLRPQVRALVIVAILLALFLFSLDNTVVADVQPAIIDTLGEIQKLPWISVAYALGGIATNLFW